MRTVYYLCYFYLWSINVCDKVSILLLSLYIVLVIFIHVFVSMDIFSFKSIFVFTLFFTFIYTMIVKHLEM